jgi:hypothetical protein
MSQPPQYDSADPARGRWTRVFVVGWIDRSCAKRGWGLCVEVYGVSPKDGDVESVCFGRGWV